MNKEDWISVDNYLPEDGVDVLVTYIGRDQQRYFTIAHRDIIDGYPSMWYSEDGFDLFTVTHWMNIVEP